MDASSVQGDLVDVMFTEAQIQAKLAEMAREIERATRARTCCSSASCGAR